MTPDEIKATLHRMVDELDASFAICEGALPLIRITVGRQSGDGIVLVCGVEPVPQVEPED
jgi:hypothetical protein